MSEEEQFSVWHWQSLIWTVCLCIVTLICVHEWWVEKERQDFLKAGYTLRDGAHGVYFNQEWVAPVKEQKMEKVEKEEKKP